MDAAIVDSRAVHPIDRLEGRALGDLRLFVPVLVAAGRPEQRRFEINVTDQQGDFFPAVVGGIHSRGTDGSPPWIAITSYELTVSRDGRTLDIRSEGFDVALFRALASVLPPGGGLRVWCDPEPHAAAGPAIRDGVPPVLTPVGRSIFGAGFPRVTYATPSKRSRSGELRAAQPLDETVARDEIRRTCDEVERFVDAPSSSAAWPQYVEVGHRLLEALRPTHVPRGAHVRARS